MTAIAPKHKAVLDSFIGSGPKEYIEIFRAKGSTTCDAAIFHQKCDNVGATVTMVYDVNGDIFGGYTSVSWISGKGQYLYDDKAFLFVLASGKETEVTEKFSIIVDEAKNAILEDEKNGPTFGAGPDLLVFTGQIPQAADGTFPVKSVMTGKSYEHIPTSLTDVITNGDACDIVVYKVADSKTAKLEVAWREEPIFESQYLEKLKCQVQEYWPLRPMGVPENALQHVNILLIGPIGSGKSSFFNTIDSVFRGHMTMSATAGSRGKSVTLTYRQYPVLAADNRKYLRFQICDCRGLEDGFFLSKEMETLLDGHVPNNYMFNTSTPIKKGVLGYKQEPKLADRIHCVVYVLDAEKSSTDMGVSFVSAAVRKELEAIQEIVDQKGIPQLILLNKVDKACPSIVKANLADINYSDVVQKSCTHAANCLGLPPYSVLPMKNHFLEPTKSNDVNILALYNLRQMLRAADDFLRVNHLEELRADKYELASPGHIQ